MSRTENSRLTLTKAVHEQTMLLMEESARGATARELARRLTFLEESVSRLWDTFPVTGNDELEPLVELASLGTTSLKTAA